jgi:hypothetical protein
MRESHFIFATQCTTHGNKKGLSFFPHESLSFSIHPNSFQINRINPRIFLGIEIASPILVFDNKLPIKPNHE